MIGTETFLAGDGIGSRSFYQFVRFIVVSFCRIYMRMTVEGRENIPASGAFVLAPIHRSYIDTPIASGCTRRRMRFMGKDSLWKKQPFRWILSALGAFPVTRGSADREAILRCIAVLERGEPLVLFPEGERKEGPEVQPLFDGAADPSAAPSNPTILADGLPRHPDRFRGRPGCTRRHTGQAFQPPPAVPGAVWASTKSTLTALNRP